VLDHGAAILAKRGAMLIARIVAVVVALVGLAGCGGALRSGPTEGGAAADAGSAVVATVRLPDFGTDVATGADGRAYVSVPGNKLVIVDPTAATVAAAVEVDGQPHAVAVTPDARRAYVVDFRGEVVAVVDTVSATQKVRLPMGTMQRPSLRPSAAASRDGSRVYVANTAKDHLFVIDTAADVIKKELFLDFHPSGVAVRSDGAYVFVVGCQLSCIDGTLRNIDATPFATVGKVALEAVPTGIVVNPEGSRAYVANGREASVTVVNLATQAALDDIPVGPEPVGIAMDDAGKSVYVTSFRDGTLTAITTVGNRVVGTARVGSSPRAVVVNGAGTRAFVTHSTRTLTIVDLARLAR
jgi:YVTN family beta-propeller protein